MNKFRPFHQSLAGQPFGEHLTFVAGVVHFKRITPIGERVIACRAHGLLESCNILHRSKSDMKTIICITRGAQKRSVTVALSRKVVMQTTKQQRKFMTDKREQMYGRWWLGFCGTPLHTSLVTVAPYRIWRRLSQTHARTKRPRRRWIL